MDLGWRIVTTGHDVDGRAVFRSDRSLEIDEDREAVRMGHVLSLPEPATSVDEGSIEGAALASGPGSLTVDGLVVRPTRDWLLDPATEASGRAQVYVVVRGNLEIVVGDDVAVLGPGDVFIPRGQPHAVRTAASEETRVLLVRAAPDPRAVPAVATMVRSASGPATRVRRVVAGTDATGRPCIVQDGDPAIVFVIGDAAAPIVALADVWEFGGAVVSADQGGDAPEPFELEPRGRGGKILDLELKPAGPEAPIQEGGWHATATIDVDVVIAGSVEMYLPDLPPVLLEAGDILLQRGTNHLWRAVGDRPLRMTTVMLGVDSREPLHNPLRS